MAGRWREHAETESLRPAIVRCLPKAKLFQGTIYRAVGFRYANQADLLTGAGAKLHGGRWNPPGLFNAVYGSLSPFAALAESGATFDRFGIPFEQRTPLVMVAVRVEITKVLDLSDGSIRRSLGISLQSILDADWEQALRTRREAVTQCLGRLCHDASLEGILVPSSRLKNEQNLVVFPERLGSASTLEVINREELPQKRRPDPG